MSNLALSHFYLGHYDEARALFEETLSKQKRALGEDHPDTLASANHLADTYRKMDRSGAATAPKKESGRNRTTLRLKRRAVFFGDIVVEARAHSIFASVS
jgi:hypothetical protein